MTYSNSRLVRDLGRPTAVRSEACANGQNQISNVIPCHRVIGAVGPLTGYSGGLWRKEWLLRHEKKFCLIAWLAIFSSLAYEKLS
ncbi:methylated-DNA-[protein]-cysteine S-methyltransferase [Bartonella tamiae Th307]|uniref:Methylated-DNA-[protein]-cysteine S-methyltransferase n=2 Tax=Bartonella tamiae TaxID=373638 RepID=J0R627_9HYPH|nr:methylated-DNA-[protein]-cysteine S-methyltransferase [Bartonella tamiae Th239]EJF93181.1 methylated-DNA-[protein]-cysteine S-methyltransferase [Bartonella tamiae Th307]